MFPLSELERLSTAQHAAAASGAVGRCHGEKGGKNAADRERSRIDQPSAVAAIHRASAACLDTGTTIQPTEPCCPGLSVREMRQGRVGRVVSLCQINRA